MLTLDRLGRRFGTTIAVAGATLDIPAGQMVGIIGRSGSGKSTLLRLVARLIDPTEGHVWWGQTDVTQLSGRVLRGWRADCALVPAQAHGAGQGDVLTDVLTGRLNDLPAWRARRRIFTPGERARALGVLRRVGLADVAQRDRRVLSPGERQRVAIARALVQAPRILLADDPTAQLDRASARGVMELLRDINRRDGLTVLCSLTRPDDARAHCDRIIGLAQGRIVFDGPPEGLDEARAQDLCEPDVGDPLAAARALWAGARAGQAPLPLSA